MSASFTATQTASLEVLGDQEQAGCVQAGDHGLADVHPAVDDRAVDRRVDRAIVQVALAGPARPGPDPRSRWLQGCWPWRPPRSPWPSHRWPCTGRTRSARARRKRSLFSARGSSRPWLRRVSPASEAGCASPTRSPGPVRAAPARSPRRLHRRGSISAKSMSFFTTERSPPVCRPRPCRREDKAGHLGADIHHFLRLDRSGGGNRSDDVAPRDRCSLNFPVVSDIGWHVPVRAGP